MKSILFITKGALPFPPVKGGAVENLLNILVEKNELYNDFKFTIFSISDNEITKASIDKYKNCSFEYINPNTLGYKVNRIVRYIINKNKIKYLGNQFIAKVIRRIKEKDITYDAIVIENAPEYAIPLRKITKKKIIQHLHNDLVYRGSLHDKNIIESTDMFLSVSNYISKRVSTINNEKAVLKTLYNGIDLQLFNKTISVERYIELRNKYNILKNEIVIIFTGRLQPHKGVKELFLAFKRIAPLYKVKLLIIGASGYSTTNKSEYIKKLEDISATFMSQVIFTGYIDYSEISSYYKIGNIAIIPSFVEEAFGLSCLEAMASGLPVIVTNSGALTEVIDEKSAFILDKNKDIVKQIEEKLILLIENKELRESMGKASKIRAQSFSSEKFYQHFKQLIYDNV